METKRENWKRKWKRLCKMETGRKRKPRHHGNERHENTVSRFHGRRVAKESFRASPKAKFDHLAPFFCEFNRFDFHLLNT